MNTKTNTAQQGELLQVERQAYDALLAERDRYKYFLEAASARVTELEDRQGDGELPPRLPRIPQLPHALYE